MIKIVMSGRFNFNLRKFSKTMQIFQKVSYSFIVLAGLFTIACSSSTETKEYIKKVDFSKYQVQLSSAKNGIESNRLDSQIFQEIEEAMIDKYLEPLYGMDAYGNRIRIDTLIDQPTLVILTSPYSNWNSVDIAKELPTIVEKSNPSFQIVNLLLKEPNPNGQALPANFYKIQIEQLQLLFPHTYLINGSEAIKLNMYALPCRYYFNQGGQLIKISKGAIPMNRFIKETNNLLLN